MSLLETDVEIRRKICKFMQEALVKYEIIIEKINREN